MKIAYIKEIIMRRFQTFLSIVIDTPTNDFSGNSAAIQSDNDGKTLIILCIIGAIILLVLYLYFLSKIGKKK